MALRTAKGRLLASTVIAGVMAGLGAGQAWAQSDASSAKAGGQPATVKEVVVTGSRIHGTSVTTTPAPVAVVSGQTIVDQGFVNAGDALLEQPAIADFSPVGGSGSPQSPYNGASGGSGQYFLNLFGIGQQRTLTLVDGRRWVSSSVGTNSTGASGDMVDVSTIPAGLIDHVEVVEAGGAAVYGSDAVGGVVNFILKKNFQGLEADAQGGESQYGDYANNSERITWGRNFLEGRANLAIDLEHSFSAPVEPENRPRTALEFGTVTNPAAKTDPSAPPLLGITGHTFPEFNTGGVLYYSPNPFSTSGPPGPVPPFYLKNNGAPLQFNGSGQLVPFNPGSYHQPAFSAGGDGMPYNDLASLYTGLERYNANVLGHVDLSDHVKLSGQFTYSDVIATDPRSQQSQVYKAVLLDGSPEGALGFNINNPYLTPQEISTIQAALANPNKIGGPLPPIANVFLSKYFAGLVDPVSTYDTKTYRANLNLEGDFNALDRNFYWSLTGTYGRSEQDQRYDNVNASRFSQSLNAVSSGGQIVCASGAAGCVPIDPFGVESYTAQQRQWVQAQFGLNNLNIQYDFLANLGGDVLRLPAGEVKFNAGYEHREEQLTYSPDANTRAGVGFNPGVAATGGSYHTDEVYAETVVPVLGEGFNVPFARALDLTGAFRHVDNSIAGQNDAWNLGLHWTIAKGFVVRGTRSDTFRAPSLYELYLPVQTVGMAAGIDPCDSREIASGPNPAVRKANCAALFQSVGLPANYQLTSLAQNFEFNGQVGGNTHLRNELAKSWSVGTVLQPQFVPGLSFTLDYVDIHLTGPISQLSLQSILSACYDTPGGGGTQFCKLFTRDTNPADAGNPNAILQITGAQTGYFNAGYEDYRGETMALDYVLPMHRLFPNVGADLGRFLFNISANHTEELNVALVGPTVTPYAGTAYQPLWKGQFTAHYIRGPLRVNYTLNYLSPSKSGDLYYMPIQYGNGVITYVPANYTSNVSLFYDITRKITARAGVDNLFNQAPSWPTSYYGDILGRRWFVGLTAKY